MKIKDLRTAAGLSQRALADRARLNISQVQKLEAGTIKPENVTLKTALALAEALGVDVKDLI